ncbi:MAG: hypothetical protein EXS50_00060 [Candidatus Taylorbacteria bacterium]|nr:hypothetical protein [Candidatus Taylorbacteria bacterium]
MNLKTFLRYSIIGGLFLIPFVPLIRTDALFFPFITGKNFSFRIIIEIISALWVVLFFASKKYRPKFSWIGVAMTLFVIIVGIADIFSENPYKSFWSNFERMEGWITMIHLLAYFFVASTVLDSEKLWNRLFNASLISSAIICFYGFFQLVGKIVINQGGVRLDATLGNAAYLAGYMLIHVFITFIMMWRHRKSGWAISIYSALLICQLIIIYYTATRGAILGLVGGVICALTLYVFLDFFHFKSENKKLRRVLATLLVCIVIVGGIFWKYRHTPFIANNPVLSRIASISSDTAAPRVMLWSMAYRGFTESPKTIFIGWGQESFNYVFNKYYNPKMWNQEQWFDRAHNVFFDWLISAGALGLLGYLSLFFLLFWYIWRINKLSLLEKSLFSGLLVGYFFHNFFVFDNITSYIMFGTLLAYIHFASAVRPIKFFENAEEASSETSMRLVLPIMLVILIFVLYVFNIRPLSANINLLSALHNVQLGRLDPALVEFKKVFAYRTMATSEALEQISSMAVSFGGNKTIPEKVKLNYFILTKKEFSVFADNHHKDARYQFLYGNFLGRFGLNSEAAPYLKRARDDSPQKQTILFELGSNYYSLGDLQNTYEIFKYAYELEPANDIARNFFYNASGIVFGDVVKKEPNNVDAHLSLATAYVQLGQKSLALSEISIVLRLDPSYKRKVQPLLDIIDK